MRVAVAVAATPFRPSPERARGEALCSALRTAGAEAELVGVPFAPNPPLAVAPQLLSCRLLDLSQSMGATIDRLVGLGLPASAMPHADKVLWHGESPPHFWAGRPGASEAQSVMERALQQAAAESRQVYVTSRFAAGPLARDVREVDTLYEPSPLAPFLRSAAAEDYILADGCAAEPRLTLLLEALGRVRSPMRIVAVAPHWPEAAAGQAERSVPGRVSFVACSQPAQLAALVAAARGVLVAPALTGDTATALAAMQCARPLIVPNDAGAPLELVMHGQTGLICEPAPASLADALETLWGDRRRARNLGRGGRQYHEQLDPTWNMVARCLLASD